MRQGSAAYPRAASAPPPPRTPPASPPPRDRSRRTGRRASRGRGPTHRGRPRRAARLSLHDWTHLDGTAHAGRRNACGNGRRLVEVVRLEQEEAPDVLLGIDERAVAQERLAVLHAHGRRRLRALQLHTVENTGFIGKRLVLGDDRLELVFRNVTDFRRAVDQQRVLHGSLLARVVLNPTTNGPPLRGQRPAAAAATCRPARCSCCSTCSASVPPRSQTCSTPARPRSRAPCSASEPPSKRGCPPPTASARRGATPPASASSSGASPTPIRVATSTRSSACSPTPPGHDVAPAARVPGRRRDRPPLRTHRADAQGA